MSVLNVMANVVGIASMVTMLSDNFHHTLSSVQIEFISLSFSFERQFLTFANSYERKREKCYLGLQ